MNEIQSYYYIDNDKYKKIEKLIKILRETFGFGTSKQTVDGQKLSESKDSDQEA